MIVNLLLAISTSLLITICVFAFFFGAISLFIYADTKGRTGIKIYIACWVLLFPVTVLASTLLGLYYSVQVVQLIRGK